MAVERPEAVFGQTTSVKVGPTGSGGAAASTAGPSDVSSPQNPSSMMLWKKVQHYVVFGGSFITMNKRSTNEMH